MKKKKNKKMNKKKKRDPFDRYSNEVFFQFAFEKAGTALNAEGEEDRRR